ncbi:sensor histidine kinase [Ornithinimicrobium cerasi]|uniref:histidine kinase n=1 Tax=Ornithinimicrobium cerasi TaxID=2248773 RepID=A0A285VS76_9MICO|nr:histidine kinase [Ornithinimicrobium cerasi]SOC56905.1 Signal transduction histidine kinase [Ornithinimicrobium cerasi]
MAQHDQVLGPEVRERRWPRGPSWLPQVPYVAVTLVATALDLYMTIPPADLRDGHHYLMWGRLDVSVWNVVVTMGVVWLGVLLLRRRHPLAVLVAISGASVALTVSNEWSQPISAVLVVLYTAARSLPPRPALVALAVGSAPLWSGPALRVGELTSLDVVLGMAILFCVALGVWLFGRRENRADRTAAQLRDELEALGQEAATQERQRIARELHDILAHSVSAMMMQAAGAAALTRTIAGGQATEPRLGSVEAALTTIERTGAQSMRELHRLLSALREDGGDGALVLDVTEDGGRRPGIGDIDALAELTRQSGLVVQIHRAGEAVELDPSVRLAGYRVAQESLANAMKHAGRGAVVDIFKSWQPDRLQLQVRSRGGHDGARPGTPGSGTGLVGLRERVELVGGTFEADWVGDEFVTTAVLPLTAPRTEGGRAEGGRGEGGRAETGRGEAGRAEGGRPTHIRSVDDPADGAA